MAWTTPTTRTTGERITDTIWNISAVDDLIYLYTRLPRYVCVRDQKAAGTDGGTFTQAAWRTRDINTEVYDEWGLCSIAANQITLAAGTYRCLISCPAFRVQLHKTKLYNVTTTTDLIIGSTEISVSTAAYATNRSFIQGSFVLTAASVLEIQHYCQVTSANQGFGYPYNIGTVEVYSIAEFWQINY